LLNCTQARRQDLAAGGPKNRRAGRIFKTQWWMYAAIEGVKREMEEGRVPLPPPLATALTALLGEKTILHILLLQRQDFHKRFRKRV